MYHKSRMLQITSALALVAVLLFGGILLPETAPAAQGQTEQDKPDESLPIWSDTPEGLIIASSERQIVPKKYRTVRLNVNALQQLLQATPLEVSAAAQSALVLLSLPLPDGTFGRFQIVEAPIMVPELAAKFPEIKTYAGQGIDDPTATVRFDWTPAGFHAQILAASGAVYIDPYSRTDTVHYISYYKRDYQPPAGRGFKEPPQPNTDPAHLQELRALVEQYQASRVQAAAAVGTELRTYRMAMAANGEYTQLAGGPAAAMATIATTVNRVTGIYETEVAIRFVLVADNDLLLYTDPATDPYSNTNTVLMLTENQATLDTVIGNPNYDIGHLLHTGPGGVAFTPAVCDNNQKAGGNSGNGTDSIGDFFIVDFVAHEIGHQFSAGHIFNDSGPCASNRAAATAYEPGSGSTIMSYAGYCESSNLQAGNDPLFNSASFEQIVAYSTLGVGNSCAAITNTGNTPPVVNAGAGGFTIPRQTPFTLTGLATDADSDALTYSWEEHDLGDADGSLANNPLEAPFFRSFPPVASPSRTFPKMSDIVNNTSTIGEVLPNVTRALNFRLTARDNRANGSGVDYASITFNVTTAAGPFLVTAPNTAVTWTGNAAQNVTWIVCTFTNTFTPPPATGTIVISSDSNGSVPGLSYRDEDIMAYNPNTGLWSLVFDGSDVGLGNVDVDGFAFLSNGHLLLSVDKDFTLSGFGPVDESDILEFIPSSYGPTTSGSYAIYFDGSDVGLSSSDEDVDAIDFDASGKLLISVNGEFKAQSVKGNDEDLFVLTGFTPGANTNGTWSLYFDGSDVGLTSSGEDLFSLWADHANSKLYLTTHDNFSVPGASGDEDDIFVCRYTSLGSNTACTFTFFWNGDTVGFDDDAIDGLSIGTPPTVVTTAESEGTLAVDDTVEYAGDDINEPNPLDGEEGEDEAVQNNTIFLPLITN